MVDKMLVSPATIDRLCAEFDRRHTAEVAAAEAYALTRAEFLFESSWLIEADASFASVAEVRRPLPCVR
jgi:hypothetical protein